MTDFTSRWPEQGRELRWCEVHDYPAFDHDGVLYCCAKAYPREVQSCRIGPAPANIRDAILHDACREVRRSIRGSVAEGGRHRGNT